MTPPSAGTPVGSKEIADWLGVKYSTVHVWNTNGLLPDPDWIVGGRPAWRWGTIKKWAKLTNRL